MIINREFTVTCRACGEKFKLFEYKGLEGGRYGSHHCEQLRELLKAHPRIQKLFKEPYRSIA